MKPDDEHRKERSDLLSKLGLDVQNKAALGRVLGTGNIGQAKEKSRRPHVGHHPHQP